MLKTKINSVTLSGCVTYDTITDSTVPSWRRIEVYNSTGSTIYYKINSGSVAGQIPAGDIFYIESNENGEACADVITFNGAAATISVEIQYYYYD